MGVAQTIFNRTLSSNILFSVGSWLAHVKTLSPTALDFEIRNLSLGFDLVEFRALLRAIAWTLGSGRDFEVPETLLNHFLKVHGDVVVDHHADLSDELDAVKDIHSKVWGRIREQLSYARCMIGFAQRIQ